MPQQDQQGSQQAASGQDDGLLDYQEGQNIDWAAQEAFGGSDGSASAAGDAPPAAEAQEATGDDAAGQDTAAAADSDAAEAFDSNASLPEDMSPEDTYKAMQYFQSQRDKVAHELEEVQAQNEQLQGNAPLVEYIQQDPQLLKMVSDYLNEQGGQPAGAQPRESPGAAAMQRPAAPTKPEGYDPYEAVSDPDSKSYTYRESKEQYLEDLAAYNESRAQSVEQQLQHRQQAERAQSARSAAVQEAVYEHGLNQQQAQDFVQWASSEESLNDMGVWVAAWQNEKGVTDPIPAEALNGASADGEESTAQPTAEEQRSQGTQFPDTATAQRGRSQTGQQGAEGDLLVQQDAADPVWGDSAGLS